MAEEKFEDGKQVEDYLNDLNSIPVIEPEPNPEATQRLETVVEEPVRNKNTKKPEAKKQPSPEAPKPTIAPQPSSITDVATPVNPQPQTPPTPQPVATPEVAPKPIEQPPTPQPAPQPKVLGVDDYIETINVQAANQRYQEVKTTAYKNINALFQGELVLVPAQQLQQMQQQAPPQQPMPQTSTTQLKEPEVQTSPQVGLIEQLKRLDIALNDPSIASVTKTAIRKKKYELLGIPYEEAPTEPAPVSPVNPKSVNDGKPKKPQKKWSIKVAIALVAVVALAGVGIVLLIGAVLH